MTEEIDIYRSAMIFVKKHGENAKIEAAHTALSTPDLDLDGLSTWCRILSAIEDIQNNNVPECVN